MGACLGGQWKGGVGQGNNAELGSQSATVLGRKVRRQTQREDVCRVENLDLCALVSHQTQKACRPLFPTTALVWREDRSAIGRMQINALGSLIPLVRRTGEGSPKARRR